MTPFSLTEIDAVVFDVIGTLVDEDAVVVDAARRLAADTGVTSASSLRDRWVAALDTAMAAVVTESAPWRPHARLVAEAARDAVTALGGTWGDAAEAVAASVDVAYAAWPEVPDATAALREHVLVAALSNGDLDALARVAHAQRLCWDVVLSTGAVGTFKPAARAYLHVIDTLRLEPSRTLFVAAHPWDLRAAAGHGFRTAYVARPGAERPTADDRVDVEVEDLTGLVAALSG
ncbi:haloacid dehalogenase type II [Nocardioides anomalus]|uniref:Haloacid dehalogenase type II n=1 Tax=Nocardioides anomalus TaxID=2712223 RepID=A0A6G6WCJ9_9ACTN|nr:haloacid dehalogenase type II [Nocardioides anomalus]QIG42954.1 haloacid dehalogenase type II [Nocardioides anomalus]